MCIQKHHHFLEHQRKIGRLRKVLGAAELNSKIPDLFYKASILTTPDLCIIV